MSVGFQVEFTYLLYSSVDFRQSNVVSLSKRVALMKRIGKAFKLVYKILTFDNGESIKVRKDGSD